MTEPKRGRGRPSTGRTETVWVRLSPETKQWLDRYAHEINLSTSAVAGAWIEERRHEWEHRNAGAPHPLLRED